MDSRQRYKKTLELLRGHGQEHLLAFYDRLDDQEQQKLLDQIDSLDFSVIPGWVDNYVVNDSPATVPSDFEPALSIRFQ